MSLPESFNQCSGINSFHSRRNCVFLTTRFFAMSCLFPVDQEKDRPDQRREGVGVEQAVQGLRVRWLVTMPVPAFPTPVNLSHFPKLAEPRFLICKVGAKIRTSEVCQEDLR